MGRCKLVSSTSGQGLTVSSYEHSNQSSGSRNGGEFLDFLSDYQLLKEYYALVS